MMKKTTVLLPVIVLLIGCVKDESLTVREVVPRLPDEMYAYKGQVFPSHPGSWAVNRLNSITDDRATLGRVLFYDTRLSVSNTISCGSCHRQSHAFADPDRFSSGFRGEVTRRNSQPVFNLALNNVSSGFFWDTRVESLDNQVLMPVFDHVEMGMSDISQVIHRISEAEYYPKLFESAFGTPQVTEQRIRDALKDFLVSMISLESRYDRAMHLGEEQELNSLEALGMKVYQGKGRCQGCHGFREMVPWGTANIGLDINYTDNGRGEVTGQDFLNGQFKIPTLRNIGMTAPYMHDGRFRTLEEVIEHYDSGVRPHPNLDFRLRATDLWGPSSIDPFSPMPLVNPMTDGMEPVRLNLTPLEKTALKAFLLTLTDYDLLNDPKFSDPFVH